MVIYYIIDNKSMALWLWLWVPNKIAIKLFYNMIFVLLYFILISNKAITYFSRKLEKRKKLLSNLFSEK